MQQAITWANVDPDLDKDSWQGDVIKWEHFPRNWPFMRGLTGPRWIPLTKASDAELLCFLWSAPEQAFE